MTPKVSVLVPIYGVEKYIKQCASSLFAQTLDHIEFIFIDDCSPDRSIEVLNDVVLDNQQRISDQNWTVKILKMPQNSGLAAVRKHGIQAATGQFIQHCDSDDWMEPNMCEMLYKRAEKDKSDIVFCDYYINSVDKESIFDRNDVDYGSKEDVFCNILTSYKLNPVWGVLAKRELYENIVFPKGSQSEDKTFMIQLIYYSTSISKYEGALYHYRITPNSISRSVDLESIIKRYTQLEDNRFIINDFAKENGLLVKYPKEFQAFFFETKMILLPYLNDETCRKLWKNSFPEYNKGILTNPYVSFIEKFSFYKNKFLH